jgi:hypothetical protein
LFFFYNRVTILQRNREILKASFTVCTPLFTKGVLLTYTNVMTRGILIAGNEAALTAAVAREAAKRVDAVATALIANRLDGLKAGQSLNIAEGSSQIPLRWNPASPISARTLLLAAESRLGRIDDAVLVCAPPSIRKKPGELSPNDIEILAGDHIKGWFFLIRELALYFCASPDGVSRSGTLALVVPDISSGGKDDPADIAGPAAAASFRAFAQGVLLASAGEPYRSLGFSTGDAGNDEEFAAYIFKIIDEGNKRDSGRWFRFGRLNLFR